MQQLPAVLPIVQPVKPIARALAIPIEHRRAPPDSGRMEHSRRGPHALSEQASSSQPPTTLPPSQAQLPTQLPPPQPPPQPPSQPPPLHSQQPPPQPPQPPQSTRLPQPPQPTPQPTQQLQQLQPQPQPQPQPQLLHWVSAAQLRAPPGGGPSAAAPAVANPMVRPASAMPSLEAAPAVAAAPPLNHPPMAVPPQVAPFRTPLNSSSKSSLQLGAPLVSKSTLGGGSGRYLAERREWKPEEDAQIRASVAKHGFKWRLVAADVPGRSDDAVRNRWNRIREDDADNAATSSSASANGESGQHKGDPSVSPLDGPPRASRSHARRHPPDSDKPERVTWSRFEDETILRSVHDLGHRWNSIANRLPGRTEHAIRNRYARLQSLASRGKPIMLSSGHGVPLGIQLVPQQ